MQRASSPVGGSSLSRGPREARVLAAVLRAAGLSSLVVAGACADRPLESTEGSPTSDSGVMTNNTDPEATSSATETTGPTTVASMPTSDFPDCPIEIYETLECGDPGAGTTGEETTGPSGMTTGAETTGTTGTTGMSGTTSGTTTGDETTGMTGSTTADETGGLCDGYEPSLGGDCGIEAVAVSEVFEQRGQCCVRVTWESGCCGRPFLVEETARTASAIRRGDWRSSPAPALAGLSAAERAGLAAEWCADGLVEHASVAAFARFVLQLLALGAPAEQVTAAQQAMADEIEHARVCFGLAAAYGGAAVGPSALPLAGALTGAEDLVTVTVAALREGCVGETIAALQAEAALERARDPAVRAALAKIAADELRHAELAWRFVAWALERGGPQLHAACAAALAEAERGAVVMTGHVEEDMSEGLRAHGRLGTAGRAAVARQAWAAVIGPAAQALLGRHLPMRAA